MENTFSLFVCLAMIRQGKTKVENSSRKHFSIASNFHFPSKIEGKQFSLVDHHPQFEFSIKLNKGKTYFHLTFPPDNVFQAKPLSIKKSFPSNQAPP